MLAAAQGAKDFQTLLKEDAEIKIGAIPGVMKRWVEIVIDPPWDPSRMSDVARLQLNMF